MNDSAAVMYKPRFPFHPEIETRFGVDKNAWKVLCEAIFPLAKSSDAICLALAYCKTRNLDPFKRPVHIVPMRTKSGDKWIEVDTIWPGISELRTTAFRTGNYAGLDRAEFGPFIEETFEDTSANGKYKGRSKRVTVKFPEWCQITVWRMLGGVRCPFVGPKVYWLETYAKWADTIVPNDRWATRSIGQLEKCAEAAALRRAFPEEIGNELTAEEMEGQHLNSSTDALQASRPLAEMLSEATPSKNGFGQSLTGTPVTDEITDGNTISATGHEIDGAEIGSIVNYLPRRDELLNEGRLAAQAGAQSLSEFLKQLAVNDPKGFDILENDIPELKSIANDADTNRRHDNQMLLGLQDELAAINTVDGLKNKSLEIGASSWYKTASRETKLRTSAVFKTRHEQLTETSNTGESDVDSA